MREVRELMGMTALCAALMMTVAGCGDSGGGETTEPSTTSSSSTSSQPTYDENHIMDEVRRVDKELRKLGPNDKISADAAWATSGYRTAYNEGVAATEDAGAKLKGKVTTDSLRLADSEPDAPGGWNVTVYLCATSTVRAYIDGEDVSADPEDSSKPLPKGPRTSAFLESFTTPDGGRTWQLDDSQVLTGTDGEKARCGG